MKDKPTPTLLKEDMVEKYLEFYDQTPTRDTVKRIALQMYREGVKVGRQDATDATSAQLLQQEGETETSLADRQFYTFWELYQKKVGMAACLKVWHRLSKKDRRSAILYAPLYVKAQPDKKYRKNPLTFLRQKAWLDELIPSNVIKQEDERRQRTEEAAQLAQALADIGLE